MRSIPAPGTKVWASVVFPGMIVATDAGEQVEVEQIDEGHDTFTFDNGYGRTATVAYADQVTVLGYFNPEVNDEDA